MFSRRKCLLWFIALKAAIKREERKLAYFPEREQARRSQEDVCFLKESALGYGEYGSLARGKGRMYGTDLGERPSGR